ncbi:hypothetical protein NDU88_002117 [Pleurodeles waltl]|uniref:Uncharacterized protein n=1 Tax=Pleurodeles waltl TaxID=8319 RepID=A0AAV7MM84_PLEWA|nr:hypothetical protein NDU88_002117 [Pleurodeles waltl]
MGRTGSARTIPLLVLALPMMIRKSSEIPLIRAAYGGHCGKTEVQEARHLAFREERRTRRKTEEWTRTSQREDGSSRSPASGFQGREANKEENGGVDEDVSGRTGETKEPYVPIGYRKTGETKEPYVPTGGGRSGETRTSFVPIGDRRTSLREAECGSPPRAWKWPGQG